jgi:diketogulonate reductase-like aldo/keto reductase
MTTVTNTRYRRLGRTGPQVFPVGLGCMGMSGMYGAVDEAESLATIHAAIDAGVNLLDTGDFYGMGHNEMLIGRALHFQRDQVLLSVKFGAQRGPDGSWLGYDARPAAVKTALAYTLKRLGVTYIDIYRPSRLDPSVPIEDPAGGGGSSRCGFADRVFACEPRAGAEDLRGAGGAGHCGNGLRGSLAGAVVEFAAGSGWGFSRTAAAVYGREPRQ